MHFSNEIRMSVRKYIDVQVKLKEAVKVITVPNDSSLDTDSIFIIGLDRNRVIRFVELCEVRSIFTILIDHFGVPFI